MPVYRYRPYGTRYLRPYLNANESPTIDTWEIPPMAKITTIEEWEREFAENGCSSRTATRRVLERLDIETHEYVVQTVANALQAWARLRLAD